MEDNGKGIPEELKKQIFDPFYQIKPHNNNKGIGVGLFLAKYLSKMLEGTIEVGDSPSGGSVFKFTFGSLSSENIFTSQEIEKKEADIEKPQPDTKKKATKKTILVVEDNPDMLHFIANSLKSDYQVDTSENARDAIRKIDVTSYDLIVTDIMMPEIDGFAFTKQLRGNINYSHIPIILLSAKTDNDSKIAGLNLGADVFIEKPFSTNYLKAQIYSLLANRRKIVETFNKSPLMSYAVLTTNKGDKDFIDKLNQEIDENISDCNFSIESMADRLSISRSHFHRKLKSISGFTPGDYLRIYRLKKAVKLMLEKGQRINEVAMDVGFSDPSYFTKCFVKQFGVLPKEFIKRHTSGMTEQEE